MNASRSVRLNPWLARVISVACVICLLFLYTNGCVIAESNGAQATEETADGAHNAEDGEADQMDIRAFQLGEAILPKGFPRPFSDERCSDEDWWNAVEAKDQAVIPQPESIRRFAWRTAAMLAEKSADENLVYSPMSLWFCACMMTHLTKGGAQEQLLALLDAESEAALDQQLAAAFLSVYCYDTDTACVPGASLWLNSGVSVDQAVVDALAAKDHASVFRGDMSDEAYNMAMRKWLNRQTGGKMADAAGQLRFAAGSSLSVCTTL